MADFGEMVEKKIREITECPICMSVFSDPRMLPCIHTFCFECLRRSSEEAQKNPGDKMPCPLCRKEFIIPAEGVNGVQKNIFMANLLEVKAALQPESATIICDMCNIRNEGNIGQISTATMRCLECQDNYCDSCVKVHQFQKLSKDHQVVKIGSDNISVSKRVSPENSCTKHTEKPLDNYCANCKKIVCVSCFAESHKSHDCKDVATFHEQFRQTIKDKAIKTLRYADEMVLMNKKTVTKRTDFIKEIEDKEKQILKRNQELKDMIDRHTKSLLDELSALKSKHLKELATEMEDIDKCCVIFRSFGAYCTELRSKGSASDICSSVDQLLARADELAKDHEAFIGRPRKSVEVTFRTADFSAALQKSDNNIVGTISDNNGVDKEENVISDGRQTLSRGWPHNMPYRSRR